MDPCGVLQTEWGKIPPRTQGALDLLTSPVSHFATAVSNSVSASINLVTMYHLWGSKISTDDKPAASFVEGTISEITTLVASPVLALALAVNSFAITLFGATAFGRDLRRPYLYMEALSKGPGAYYVHRFVRKKETHRPDHDLLFRGSTFHQIRGDEKGLIRKEVEPRIKAAIDYFASFYLLFPLVISNVVESAVNISFLTFRSVFSDLARDDDFYEEIKREGANMVLSPFFQIAYKLNCLAMVVLGSEFEGVLLNSGLKFCEEAIKGKPAYALSNLFRNGQWKAVHSRMLISHYRYQQTFAARNPVAADNS